MVGVKDKGHLYLIVDSSNRIETLLENVSREKFFDSVDLRDAVAFNFFKIGEQIKLFSQSFLDEYYGAPWWRLCKMSNIVSVPGEEINWDGVWEIATNDIKSLREYCEFILKENK